MSPRRPTVLLFLFLALAAAAATAPAAGAATVWAVGDAAVPGPEDDQVAAMIQRAGLDHLLYLGDVYETGTWEEYMSNYHPGMGRFKAITSPAPGNHEWGNRAVGYDRYWGPRVRQPDGGHYYSFDIAGWHVVSLNSEEPIGEGSRQLAWLRRDLAARPDNCTIAFDHKPRYGSGGQGDNAAMDPAWRALRGRAVGLLSGHAHNYQRLRPIDGLVQFIAGTGGRYRHAVDESDPRIAASTEQDFGALRLRLERGRADFAFVSLSRGTLDAGSLGCSPAALSTTSPAAPFGTPAAAVVRIRSPRSGSLHSSRLRRLAGTASGGQGEVRLSLVRRAGGRCAVLSGGRFRQASCRSRRSVAAGGAGRWSYRLPRRARLRRGAYTLTARLPVAGGTMVSDRVRFRVR